MTEEPPGGAGPPSNETWSVPASTVRPPPTWRRRARAIVVWTLRVVGTLAAVTLAAMGPFRQRSLDLPLPHDVRVGLFRNGAPVHWTCDEGHDHWSIPFWMGALLVAVPTSALWLVAADKRDPQV
jgi:hypothetical protein